MLSFSGSLPGWPPQPATGQPEAIFLWVSHGSPPRQVPEHLGYLPLFFLDHQQAAGKWGVRQVEYKPLPIKDAGTAEDGFTCDAPTLGSGTYRENSEDFLLRLQGLATPQQNWCLTGTTAFSWKGSKRKTKYKKKITHLEKLKHFQLYDLCFQFQVIFCRKPQSQPKEGC